MAEYIRNETPIEWNNLLDDRLSKVGRVIKGRTYDELIAGLEANERLVGTGFICLSGYHDFGAVIKSQEDLQSFKKITYDSTEDNAKWFQLGKKRANRQKQFSRWRFYAISADIPTFESDLEISDLTRQNVKRQLNNLP